MKKLLPLVFVLALVLGLTVPLAVMAGSMQTPEEFDLYAGRNIPIGKVLVWNDGNNLCVKYVITQAGWVLKEIHLDIEKSMGDIPQTKGNPIPGRFEFYDDFDPLDHVTVSGPWCKSFEDLGITNVCNKDIFIAAHASVVQYGYREETAWGANNGPGTEGFPGKNWATYIQYNTECADLSIVKSDSPDPVFAGLDLTYTLTYKNNSGCGATGVVVTDTLPEGVIFGISAPVPDDIVGQTLTWNIGSLAAGAEASIAINVTAPSTIGTITNNCSISGEQPDPNPTNNTDSENTAVLGPMLNTVIGNSTCFIPRADACGRIDGRTCESLVGDLTTDSMRTTYNTDFAITNAGGLRGNVTCPMTDIPGDFCPAYTPPPYPITRGQVLAVLPFGNLVATLQINGAELKTYLENGVSLMPAAQGRFPQVSGLCFTYDISMPAGSRVLSVVRQAADGSCTGAPVDLTAASTYELAINDFMASGGDGYPIVTSRITTQNYMDQVLADYITVNTPVNPAIQGRITCTSSGATPCPVVTP